MEVSTIGARSLLSASWGPRTGMIALQLSPCCSTACISNSGAQRGGLPTADKFCFFPVHFLGDLVLDKREFFTFLPFFEAASEVVWDSTVLSALLALVLTTLAFFFGGGVVSVGVVGSGGSTRGKGECCNF